MSDLVNWMKEVYLKGKNNDLEWKPVYPNNMPCNGIEGIYSEMNFQKDGKYQYVKFTVEYQARVDEEGISWPSEGTKYYVLHELIINDSDVPIETPEPNDNYDILETENIGFINCYGDYRCVFDDEETAKKVAGHDLLQLIYPYTCILKEKEIEEWNAFIEEQEVIKSRKTSKKKTNKKVKKNVDK